MTTTATTPVAGVRSVLRAAWAVALENYWSLLAITLIVETPIDLILAFVPLGESATLQDWGRYLRIQQALELWGGTVRLLAVTHIAVASHVGTRLSVREAFERSGRGYLSAVWAQMLYGFASVLGLLLLVVPGVFIAVAGCFSVPAIAVHRLSGWQALKHSRAMVAGRWWRFLGRLLVLVLIMIAGILVASLPRAFAPDGLISDVLLMVPVDLILTYFAIVFAMLYLLSTPATEVEPPTESLRPGDPLAEDRGPDQF